MGEVEDLEISAPADKTEGADHHQGQDDDERHPGGVGEPAHQPEHPGPGGEQPVPVTPAGPTRKEAFVSISSIINPHDPKGCIVHFSPYSMGIKIGILVVVSGLTVFSIYKI